MCYNVVVMYMDFVKSKWTSKDYDNFINYMFEIKDEKYRDFHSGLGVGNNIIGIRTPILKKIARDISIGNYREFLELVKCNYYEEITLYGFIICNIKNLEESIMFLDVYKNMINNWASCDLFCSGYKIIIENKEFFLNYIVNNISDENIWVRRMCFVFLNFYYVEENHLNNIFEMCDLYNTNSYYVQMSVAWLLSICYIKYPEQTILYIKNNRLDNFTHNKAIQKIKESYRVSINNKNMLDKLKRK